MRGRLFTLLWAAGTLSGCLSVLAPDVERGVAAHASVRDTTAPGVCLTCHLTEPGEPLANPNSVGISMTEAPGVPAWMLRERGGECLACHGVAP